MSKNIIILIVGATILCFAAFNNKFPLLTADTGFFINSGFNRDARLHHPTMYGFFIAHSSWGNLIWLIVFSQSFILSATLFYAFRYFTQARDYIVYWLAFLFFATFCMSASVTSSTIDPGIFASITILCTVLLLFAKNLPQRDFIIIIILTIFSSEMAMSNLLTMMLITVIYGIRSVFEKKYPISIGFQTNIKRVITVLSLVFTSFLLSCALHFFSQGDFEIINHNRSQAAIKGAAVNVFFNKIRSAEAVSRLRISRGSEKATNVFFNPVNIEIAGYHRMGEQSETFQAIYHLYNTDVRECLIARQFQGWLTFTYLNYAQIISIFLCACLIIISVTKNRGSTFRQLLFFILQVMIIQVLVSYLLGERHNHSVIPQIIWLLPLPVFLYLSETTHLNKIGLN